MKPAVDENNNIVIGTFCGLNTKDCIIIGNDDELISTIGIHDCLIMREGKKLLVIDLETWRKNAGKTNS